MKKTLINAGIAFALAVSMPVFAEDATGDWTGMVNGSLRINVHVSKSADGQWEGVLQSPDQSNASFKVDKIDSSSKQLSFSLAKFNASYAAEWDESKKAWVGSWTQNSKTPLNLTRLDANALAAQVKKRPQEEAIAKNTAPYSSNEINFINTKAQIQFAGTMTVPQGKGPFPAVVLVHGSGRNTRDEELLGHKVFLVLADHLSKQGIAVLRYDKRGVAGSKGDYNAATSFDFADDAQAAVEYLRTRSDVDQKKIGMVGHSEGGIIAPIVAARDPKLGFIVLMAGPGIRGDALLLEQSKLISRANGESEEEIEADAKLSLQQFAIMTADVDDASITARLKVLMEQAEATGAIPKGAGAVQLETLNKPWYRAFVKYDPAVALKKVNQPVLAVNGELDLQVPAKLNLDGIRAALKHNKKLTVQELPKINHAFQTATTGSPREYGKIEETFAPTALNAISSWIRQQ
jgi:pimeloyl-ACP methyl ester carboxylesterase